MIIDLLTKRYPGMRTWLVQRLTALVMALYTIVLFVVLLFIQPESYIEWRAFFSPCWFRFATWLFWISLTVHAWLGVRDVLKDYVPNYQVRTVLIKIVIVALSLEMVWATWLLAVVAKL